MPANAELRAVRPALLLALLLTACGAQAAAAVDIPALVQCQQGVAEHAAFSAAVTDPLGAVSMGLEPLPQQNLFMTEYRLAQPISVFGQRTEQLALAGASVMAVLDLADPRPLAKELKLDVAFDEGGKFMAGRELISRDVTDPVTGEAQIESIILSISTVTSHPGKSLVGCTYSLDLPPETP